MGFQQPVLSTAEPGHRRPVYVPRDTGRERDLPAGHAGGLRSHLSANDSSSDQAGDRARKRGERGVLPGRHFAGRAGERVRDEYGRHGTDGAAHERLHRARREGKGASDLVVRVAEELSREARLLCFDEFSVSDIADATILARLFSALFSAGVVVVATSNVEPQRLYEGGRNRDPFLPFVALLQERMEVVWLDARTDFRREKTSADEVYFIASDLWSKAAAEARLTAHMGAGPYTAKTLRVKGRDLRIPRACGRVAHFDFAQICGCPLGGSDYLALTKNFDTIIVDDVPAMSFDRRNEAKRFIMLVDMLYDAKTKLILCAQAEIKDLYHAEHGAEALEFPRTVSRLVEMRSRQYLEQWAARRL